MGFGMPRVNIEAARKAGAEGAAPPSSGTPFSLNTPDILNSLINITSNPFFNSEDINTPTEPSPGGDDDKVFATLESRPLVHSPPSKPLTSVSDMRSRLIKDSLKLTIQSKRKNSGKDELDLKAELEVTKMRKSEEVDSYSIESESQSPNKLTPEDEERRKRRRERNKIAATKCRNKKKEKTGILVHESESLEGNNLSLKSEISKLEIERQRLVEVLAAHAPTCKQHLQQVAYYSDYNHNLTNNY